MLITKCIWEKGIFSGKDIHDVTLTIDDYKVMNADELKRELDKRPRDVSFCLEMSGRGMYSSLWNWNFPPEEEDEAGSTDKIQNSPPVCGHEWTNQGFTHVIMACKFCGQKAPTWVQTKNDPKSR